MLYQVGPLTLDTFPMEVGEFEGETIGDYAKHPLMSVRKDYEAVGPGEDRIALTGQVLPFHIGGMNELEVAKRLVQALQPVFVMRGDGTVLGWYVPIKLRERHKLLARNGVGYVVTYDFDLERIDDPGTDVGGDLIDTLFSLFG